MCSVTLSLETFISLTNRVELSRLYFVAIAELLRVGKIRGMCCPQIVSLVSEQISKLFWANASVENV